MDTHLPLRKTTHVAIGNELPGVDAFRYAPGVVGDIRCTRCGARLGADEDTCTSCGAVIVLRPTAEHGPATARVATPPVSAERAVLRCPRCGVAMVAAACGETNVHGCEACGGVWLDPTGVTQADHVKDEDLVSLADRIVGVIARRAPNVAQEISCPSCTKPTRRVAILKSMRDVDVDVCEEHGTWFDRGELGRLVRAHKDARTVAVNANATAILPVPDVGSDLTKREGGDDDESFFSQLFRSLKLR